MISGAHVIVYSKDAEADRAFLRDVLRFSHVDVGGGWLIFSLPPAEVAVHPSEGSGSHELYLMCEDIEAFRAEIERHGHATAPPQSMGWGILTEVALPGGGKLGVYQPRHERPRPMGDGSPAKAKRATKPAARKSTKQASARSTATAKAKKPSPKRSPAKPARKPGRARR